MGGLKTLFKQTFIYGLATVLPRMLSFLLTPLYTEVMAVGVYGRVSIIFSWFAIFNVVLAYGMETAFFRFFNKEESKDKVISTSSLSIIFTSFVIFVLAFIFKNSIALATGIEVYHIKFVIWILFLDALVIIPFAWLRANAKPIKYAIIKIVNVAINIGFNLFFFLLLPGLAESVNAFSSIYQPNFEISYVLISNLFASTVTLILMASFYVKIKYNFNVQLWKKMTRYAFPVLISGLAFTINETYDRILLNNLLPETIAETKIGMYSACYKLALFMTLFATAFRLGIEPYFFSHSKAENPQKNYAKILEYFVIFGSGILLTVVVFADVLKVFIIRDQDFWEAMSIVPIILLASFCLGIYHNLSVWYKITDRTKFGAYISIVGALVTLIINVVFIPSYGYKASAVATLAAYAIMMLLSFYFGRKYYPIPYNLKKISLYLSLSIVFSVLSFYQFRSNYIVGVSLLIVFLGVIWFSEKNQIQQLLKR